MTPRFPVTFAEQLQDAFMKLQQHIYFDNSDLYLRAQLARFLQKSPSIQLKKLEEKIKAKDKAYFETLCHKIGLRVYPKGIANGINRQQDIPSNFITNVIYRDSCEVNRLAIFCDIPFELHIISVVWLMQFGYKLDKKLDDCNYGNRLILTNGRIPTGRSLFKPYVKQYQRWWADGIEVAKSYLDEKEDVTIASFDLKDYYHRVELDFISLEKEIFPPKTIANRSFIHWIFKMIHEYYAESFKSILHSATRSSNSEGKYPLPIGLLSSSVLANWYLKKMDRFIVQNINPVFYGRYVDDILIVMKKKAMREVSPADVKRTKRYFKEHNAIILDDKINLLHAFISKYLKDLIYPKPSGNNNGFSYAININNLENLLLQEEKIFIYQFDGELSPGIVNKFVDEQKKHSSEFRFLSDEEDENFEDFEEYFFEDNFDVDEVNKAKFKVIEENKFKLSVYLAKLIQRKIERGTDYKPLEEEKVNVFFKGAFVIKHYIFWEKLFTLYVAGKRKDLFLQLYKQIFDATNNLVFTGEGKIEKITLQADLKQHLLYSMEMALGLDPLFLSQKDKRSLNEMTVNVSFFRKSGLTRKKYVRLPLLHLTDGAKKGDFSFFDQDVSLNTTWEKSDLVIANVAYTPHKIKFYEAVLFVFMYRFHVEFSPPQRRGKSTLTDAFNSLSMLDDAFTLFTDINYTNLSPAQKENLKKDYFMSSDIQSLVGEQVELNEYKFTQAGPSKHIYRVALVNKYVNSDNFLASLRGDRVIASEEVETFYQILDEISRIKNLDFFVMPELALPYSLVTKYIQFSAWHSKGVITGIEHINFGRAGFNFVLTCLPININGNKDTIPIFRLKNHYSPEEEKCIHAAKLAVAQPHPYRYSLFSWRGLYFSTYYCFELANIFHRILFYSKADLLCAPVWNRDTYYYNNIIESVTRDLHCYMLQVNTSQYGDTRVTRPTEQIRKDKAKIKGGTVDEYPFTLLVSDLEIETLREFQLLDYEDQKDYNAEKDTTKSKKTYKPTPPDFPKENVETRIKNKSFGAGE